MSKMFPKICLQLKFLVLSTLFLAFSNGKPCEEHEKKIMASIRKIVDYNLRHICSGTVLSDRWILTAAHCLADDPSRVIVGYTSNTSKVFGILASYVPEEYKEKGSTNDIGLLKLTSPILMNEDVEFVKLPPKKMTTPLKEYCNSSTVLAKSWNLYSDFNKPDSLQCLDLSIIPSEMCVSKHKSAGHNIDSGETIWCTESREVEDDYCNDDVGGPIMCNGIQIGIASWSLDCASPDIPAVFARVDTYADFIGAALKQRGSSATPGWKLYRKEDNTSLKKKSPLLPFDLVNLRSNPVEKGHAHVTIPNKIILTVVTVIASIAIIM